MPQASPTPGSVNGRSNKANQSFGLFPSLDHVRDVGPGEVKKLFFQTTSGDVHSGQTQRIADRAESFGDILNMGQKDSKYMRYQGRKAPLVDRGACKYTQDFTPKPLGDHACNRELAITFRGPSKHGAPCAFDATSSYAEHFPRHSHARMKQALLPSQNPNPGRTQTLNGSGDGMLEKSSSSHSTFCKPHEGMKPSCDAFRPSGNITVGGFGSFRSQYGHDFGASECAAQQRSNAGRAKRPQTAPASRTLASDARRSGERRLPKDVFTTGRSSYMSPGQ